MCFVAELSGPDSGEAWVCLSMCCGTGWSTVVSGQGLQEVHGSPGKTFLMVIKYSSC